MNHRILSTVVLLGLAFVIGPSQAAGETRSAAETHALLRLLQETMDMKDFENPMTVRELIGLLAVKFESRGKELPILLNYEAFRKSAPGTEDLNERPIKFAHFPKRLTVAMMLRISLSQIEDVDAMYLLRNGLIEIVPAKHATPAHLLKSNVQGAFVKTTLEDVLQDLAYQSGASVTLDPRAGDKARAAITATFRNDTTLEAALRMVAEMAELKLVVLPGGLFVTTPEQADKMLKERVVAQSASN